MMTPDERERADSHRWQMLTARVLVDVETDAARADLPVLDWSITGAKVIGRPRPFGSAAEIRDAWQAWADHLDAEVLDDTELSTGGRILRAVAERSPGRGHIDVTVLLLAELPADEEPDATLPPAAPGLDRVHVDAYAADYDPADDTPRQIWHITDRAVTPVAADRWTPRLLALLDRGRH